MKKISTLLAAAACVLGLQAQTVTVSPHDNVCDVTVDGTTYNDVAVTTEGDIHLVALNRDGVSLLVRYTDTNTVAANGTVNGQPVDYASDAVAAYALTYQIPNSDFEQWHSVGGGRQEPGAEGSTYSWHSFGTCYTTSFWTQAARTSSTLTVGTRDGGGNCAVITAKQVAWAVANGTMTTGRLQAGSTTASDKANHSEMTIGKTWDDDYNQYGPFYVTLKAKPDAIKSWMKVELLRTSDRATISAAITDGTYYQEPEDDTYTNVAALARDKNIANCGWTEFTHTFDYDSYPSTVEAKAIMVTYSTNADPGTGSDGDKVSIDDVELVYNAAISNIALNGVTLEGFAFDAATTEYNLSYSGVALNLTADNFDVTAVGQSAMVVKNVENLGGGNYRVVIGVASPDFKQHALYTINVNFNPITGKVYILGEVNDNNGWHPNKGAEMTTEDQKVYTAEVTTAGENSLYYFGFTTELANDDDEGGWNYILPYRFGAPGEGTDLSITIEDSDLGTALPLGEWGHTRAYALPAGKWNFTLDMEARTLTVTKALQRGDVTGDGTVDVQDVNAVVNIMLGKSAATAYPGNANLVGDNNAVDVEDLNAVVNIMLGKSAQ